MCIRDSVKGSDRVEAKALLIGRASHPDHGPDGKRRESVHEFENVIERDRIHVSILSDPIAGCCLKKPAQVVATCEDNVRVICAQRKVRGHDGGTGKEKRTG